MARFCAGISIGILYAAVPLYIGELVETKIRGVCSSMMPVMLHLGYIFVYGVGPRVDKKVIISDFRLKSYEIIMESKQIVKIIITRKYDFIYMSIYMS